MKRALQILLILFPVFVFAQPATVVDSVAALSTFKARRDGEQVAVRGFYVRGDWGNGLLRDYIWSATNALATNAIRLQVWTNGVAIDTGRWVHDWDGDVRAFGAKGDDITDDTASLSNAIVQAKSQRIQIYIPAGTYKTTASLDCRNSDINTMEFGGIRGDGLTLTKIKGYHSEPILKIMGRGGVYERFRIEYDSLRELTDTSANAITFYGFTAYMSFRDVEVVYGYRLLYSDASSLGLFSCTFDNVLARSAKYINVDVQSSSGTLWNNVYISNPGTDAVDYLFQDRAGSSEFSQINFEHSNFRAGIARFRGDGATIGRMHIEGVRPITDANFIDVVDCPVSIQSLVFINNFSGGHIISSISTNGVANVNAMGQAVVGGHGYRVGDSITIAGATPTNYNGTFTVTASDSSSFTFLVPVPAGVQGTADIGGGFDYIWSYLANYPAPALFATQTGGKAKIDVQSFTARNNKIIGQNSVVRNLAGLDIAREFGGHRLNVSVKHATQGSQFRLGDNGIGFNPIIASSRTNNVATAYTKYPHELSEGEYVSTSGGVNLNFGSNYVKIAGVPNRYSLTFNATGANADITTESGNLIPVKAKVLTRARSGNIATISTDVAHQLTSGSRILIRAMSSSSYSDSETVVQSVPSTTNLTYVNVGADESETPETNGIIYEFSSGLNSRLQSPSTLGLDKFDDYFTPLVALPASTIAGSTSTNHVFPVSGVRPSYEIAVVPYDVAGFDSGLRYWAGVVSNDYVNVYIANISTGSITNVARLAFLKRR